MKSGGEQNLSAPILTTARCPSKIVPLYVLSALYSIFLVYGSLVPLHFVSRPLNDAVSVFLNIPFLNIGMGSRADWVANILLFIPLSFFYNQLATLNKSGVRLLAISIAVFVAMIGLSFCIEFTQLFFPDRTTSQNDIWANCLGSLIGVVCQNIFGVRFQSWLDALWKNESSKTRLMRALNVYLLVLLAFNILPLELTISPVELYHKWVAGNVVLIPFGGLKGSFSEKLYETLTDLLIWTPVGLLWALDTKHSIVRITRMGLIAAALIELAQFFVYSRVTDITDVLLAGVGTALGALCARRFFKIVTRVNEPKVGLWISLWMLWAIFILVIFWFPYDFNSSSVTLSSAQSTIFRPLLENYYFGSEFHATNEILRKIGFFLPSGIFLGLIGLRKTDFNRNIYVIGGAAIFALALLVEFGQLYLPQKYADLTDVLVQAGGGLLGLVMTRWVLSGYSGTNKASSPGQSVSGLSAVANHQPKESSSPQKSMPHLVTFVGLVIVIGIFTHLPFVPYNVRELIEPGLFGVISVIGLSLIILWLVNGHFWFLRRSNLKYGRSIYLPLWLFAHGCVTWVLLRLVVPMESIHDIVGSPILGWFWEWELIARYLALHCAISLQVIGAIILVSIVQRKVRLEIFLAWIFWSLLLAWPLHEIVVVQAATDNLTELMSNEGAFISSTQLALGVFFFCLAGSTLSNLVANKSHYLSATLLSGIAVAIAIAFFWFGSEQFILKYGKVFSAWQFFLSTDRQNYEFGVSLYLRFVSIFSLLLTCWSLIQANSWKTQAVAASGYKKYG